MKKFIAIAALIFTSVLTYACTDGAKQNQTEKKEAQSGDVIVMNKDMFSLNCSVEQLIRLLIKKQSTNFC